MKNVLLGAAVVGVGYLVWCQYKSKKKCACSGASKASSSAPAAGETSIGPGNIMAEPVPGSASAAPALAANGDGFGKRYF